MKYTYTLLNIGHSYYCTVIFAKEIAGMVVTNSKTFAGDIVAQTQNKIFQKLTLNIIVEDYEHLGKQRHVLNRHRNSWKYFLAENEPLLALSLAGSVVNYDTQCKHVTLETPRYNRQNWKGSNTSANSSLIPLLVHINKFSSKLSKVSAYGKFLIYILLSSLEYPKNFFYHCTTSPCLRPPRQLNSWNQTLFKSASYSYHSVGLSRLLYQPKFEEFKVTCTL